MKTMNSLSDQQLITLYVEGNPDALAIVIERHKDKIFTSIYLLVKDKFLAEDLFQDCFLKAIDKLNNGVYNEEGKFLPWMIRMAHNLCIDYFRKVKRSPSIKTSDSDDIFDSFDFSECAVDDKMIKGQTHERVRKMLDLLPEDQKEVIVMRHFANLSFKEISNITGTSINTSLGRMRYGLMNLRKLMAEKQIAL